MVQLLLWRRTGHRIKQDVALLEAALLSRGRKGLLSIAVKSARMHISVGKLESHERCGVHDIL